jgi:hypothetical protein
VLRDEEVADAAADRDNVTTTTSSRPEASPTYREQFVTQVLRPDKAAARHVLCRVMLDSRVPVDA